MRAAAKCFSALFAAVLTLAPLCRPAFSAEGALSFEGDMRLRFRYLDPSPGSPGSGLLLRLRLAGEALITENLSAGFRIASGDAHPATADQMLGESFAKYGLRLDYCFINYRTAVFDINAGKFPRRSLLWTPSDLIWGEEVTPDGFSLRYTGRLLDFSAGTGVFIIGLPEEGSGCPLMWMSQLRGAACLSRDVKIEGAAAYYGFENLRGRSLTHSAGTNTTDGEGNLIYGYDSLGAGVTLSFPVPALNTASLFGEFVHSFDPGDSGFLAGVRGGSPVIRTWPDWNITHLYRRLERDAWPDITIDRGVYGGRTGASGTVTTLAAALAENTALDLAFFSMKTLTGDRRAENLLQLSFTVTF